MIRRLSRRHGARVLRERCEQRLLHLGIPTGADARTIATHVGECRGRRIQFITTELPPGGPCGLWISTDTTDYICYSRRTSPSHQDHILLHEVGHIICEHDEVLAPEGDILAALTPDLPSETMRRMLARTNYTRGQEREAELLATLLSLRCSDATRPGERLSETHEVARRIEASLRIRRDVDGGRSAVTGQGV